MKFAYADPPYFGYAHFYAGRHPEAMIWDNIETHRKLIERLNDEFSDGWALSLTSGNLHDILPLCPKDARIGAWVKPFCSFKKNVSPAYAWEPVIFRGGRKHNTENETVRDWCAVNITLQRGLTGAKPRDFCRWVISLLKAEPTDEFEDLFPGSGAFTAAWRDFSRATDDQHNFELTPVSGVASISGE